MLFSGQSLLSPRNDLSASYDGAVVSVNYQQALSGLGPYSLRGGLALRPSRQLSSEQLTWALSLKFTLGSCDVCSLQPGSLSHAVGLLSCTVGLIKGLGKGCGENYS